MSQIAIIGAGAWGTGLAIVLGRKESHRVRLWAYEADVCDSINRNHVNNRFLPGVRLPDSVRASNDFSIVLDGAKIIVSVMPSQHCRALFASMRPFISPRGLIVSATKGLEEGSLLRMTEVIQQVLTINNNPEGGPPLSRSWRQGGDFDFSIGALSGPSFAVEVARGDPTAITIASQSPELLSAIQQEFSHASFRVYTNQDVVGVELGGALKNIIAIAAGICDGLGLGHNAVAALITRGLVELTRLAVALGAKPDTLSGLAGLGDLVLTCTGDLSRNRQVGLKLAAGLELGEIVKATPMVAEGIKTTTVAMQLATRLGVELPIVQEMDAVLNLGRKPADAIRRLMTRTLKSE